MFSVTRPLFVTRPLPAQAAARTSWQGSLVERALRALAADYRRPTGPIVIAAALAVISVLTATALRPPISPGAATMLALAATVPIAVIRRFPAAAIGIILTASAVFLLAGRMSWPVSAMAGWLIALAACPLMLSRRAAIRAFALTEVVVLLAALPVMPSTTPWDATLAEALAVIAAWGAGETLRSRRQAAAHQAAAAQQVRYLSEREVLARERASIARELHDVVAHHVSMIAVRAGTAPYAIGGLPESGQEAFSEIAAQARTALTELRVVLGVLRDPARLSEAAPQPRMADLEGLLDRVRGAGTDVSLTTTGRVRSLPGSVELCGYRVVQEAVTNAGRHAPGSRVRVAVGYEQAALTVGVRNSAGRAETGRAEVGRGETGRGEAPAAAGFGLVGLRERVAMLGGQITTGPQGGGGFSVVVVLPAPAAGLAGSGAGDGRAAECGAADGGAAECGAADGGAE
jgi:signal transduction histidine kinase